MEEWRQVQLEPRLNPRIILLSFNSIVSLASRRRQRKNRNELKTITLPIAYGRHLGRGFFSWNRFGSGSAKFLYISWSYSIRPTICVDQIPERSFSSRATTSPVRPILYGRSKVGTTQKWFTICLEIWSAIKTQLSSLLPLSIPSFAILLQPFRVAICTRAQTSEMKLELDGKLLKNACT